MADDRSIANQAGATIRVFPLGEEPRDDLAQSTTAPERIAMLRELTERAWLLTGRPFPRYPRAEIPVRVMRDG
jgi:hypothetical protein